MIKASLTSIQAFLEKQEMNCSFSPKTDTIPFDQLILPLGIDKKSRDLVLLVQIFNEDLSQVHSVLNLPQEKSEYNVIQVIFTLPFQIQPEYAGEVARLIVGLNKSLEFPGFELSEVDRLIYFRSTYFATDVVDELILLTLIMNAMTQVELFSDTFESVAEGKQTLQDVINSTIKTTI